VREFVKPGRTGSMHEKTESAFISALTQAKWPEHYLAVDSMSGAPRSLFLFGYDSFEAWEKDNLATMKNPALTTALERAALADGDLLSSIDMGAFAYRPEYSLRADGVDIPHSRYFEISVFHVRPGHRKDWDDLVKMYMGAYEKIPDTHWATFECVYGQGDEYLVFNPMKSLAETDRAFAQGKQFEAAMGPEGLKKLSDLSAATIESVQTNLFMFNPRESYPPDSWVKADPEFWKATPAPRK
jgi:hypothetical protein